MSQTALSWTHPIEYARKRYGRRVDSQKSLGPALGVSAHGLALFGTLPSENSAFCNCAFVRKLFDS